MEGKNDDALEGPGKTALSLLLLTALTQSSNADHNPSYVLQKWLYDIFVDTSPNVPTPSQNNTDVPMPSQNNTDVPTPAPFTANQFKDFKKNMAPVVNNVINVTTNMINNLPDVPNIIQLQNNLPDMPTGQSVTEFVYRSINNYSPITDETTKYITDKLIKTGAAEMWLVIPDGFDKRVDKITPELIMKFKINTSDYNAMYIRANEKTKFDGTTSLVIVIQTSENTIETIEFIRTKGLFYFGIDQLNKLKNPTYMSYFKVFTGNKETVASIFENWIGSYLYQNPTQLINNKDVFDNEDAFYNKLTNLLQKLNTNLITTIPEIITPDIEYPIDYANVFAKFLAVVFTINEGRKILRKKTDILYNLEMVETQKKDEIEASKRIIYGLQTKRLKDLTKEDIKHIQNYDLLTNSYINSLCLECANTSNSIYDVLASNYYYGFYKSKNKEEKTKKFLTNIFTHNPIYFFNYDGQSTLTPTIIYKERFVDFIMARKANVPQIVPIPIKTKEGGGVNSFTQKL
jgi:hypothetical protein